MFCAHDAFTIEMLLSLCLSQNQARVDKQTKMQQVAMSERKSYDYWFR
uniref:Uncharacterized protein n=1 Tax=Arundo donax TaxID=35708 RepID=A0A0A9H6N9_ARUDO